MPMRRTVSGSTLPVSDTASASRRARSPGSRASRSAARPTGSFDSITAPTSGLSSVSTGNSRSGGSATSRSQGSARAEAAASRRRREAAVALIWPSITDSAPSIPPGKASPTESSSARNSSTTAPNVVRSTIRIAPICSVSAACMCSGSADSGRGAPSASSSRTITAAFSRFDSGLGAGPPATGGVARTGMMRASSCAIAYLRLLPGQSAPVPVKAR